MSKNIAELIEKGKGLEGKIQPPDSEEDYVEGYLPDVEYAKWKAECATYLEKEYPRNETTKIFLNEFNNAGITEISRYKKLLGYIEGMYANEIDGVIKPKSKQCDSFKDLVYVPNKRNNR